MRAKSSPGIRNQRQYVKMAAIALVVLFGVWMYYPALTLPMSLVDDYVKLSNLDRVTRDYSSGGFLEVLKNDGSFKQHTYNTGFWFWTALQWRLAGGQPFHWLKLLELTAVCVALVGIIKGGINNRFALPAALVAVVLFISGEVPLTIPLQSIRANWFRLFATDADAMVLLALHIYCCTILFRTRNGRAKRWFLVAGAVVSAFGAFSVKLPFVLLTCGPLVAVVVAAWLCRERSLVRLCATMLSCIVVAFFVYNLILRSLNPHPRLGSYGSDFSLAPGHLYEGLKSYSAFYWNLYGPVLPALLAGAVILLPELWKRRTTTETESFLTVVYVLIFTACAIGVYLPWNVRLPRYMLAGHFGFMILFGLMAAYVFRTLALSRGKRTVLIAAAFAGLLTPVMPVWIWVILLIIACAFRLWKQSSVPAIFISGFAASGVLYILSAAPAQRGTMNNFYVGGEVANWQATLAVMRLSAEKRTVCFAGSAMDEHIGSMIGHIQRLGVEPLVSQLGAGQCASGSYILVNRWLTPRQFQRKIAGLPIFMELDLPREKYNVPVSFWTFSERLRSRRSSDSWLYDVWTTSFVWRIYGPFA